MAQARRKQKTLLILSPAVKILYIFYAKLHLEFASFSSVMLMQNVNARVAKCDIISPPDVAALCMCTETNQLPARTQQPPVSRQGYSGYKATITVL